MKKIFVIVLAAILFGGILTGCNMQILDTTFSYDEAQIVMPNGEIVSGKCDGWRDYEDGDQLQVVIDGITYLTHAENVVLIAN